MLCLYKPYSCSRVAAGGFSAPVRILLTMLSAWLNTRSAARVSFRLRVKDRGRALGTAHRRNQTLLGRWWAGGRLGHRRVRVASHAVVGERAEGRRQSRAHLTAAGKGKQPTWDGRLARVRSDYYFLLVKGSSWRRGWGRYRPGGRLVARYTVRPSFLPRLLPERINPTFCL
jgi:hypothetical protein